MSAKSSVIPPSRKLEKLVMATAVSVKKAAKTTILGSRNIVLAVNVDMKVERITTKLVMEPSTSPATISIMGSFFSRRFPILCLVFGLEVLAGYILIVVQRVLQ